MENKQKSTFPAICFRVLWLLIGLAATVTTVTDRLADGNPIALYFTAWSVWLGTVSAAFSLAQTLRGKREGRLLAYLRFSADIMLIATFIVAAFVLPDKLWTAGYWNLGSILKHFLMPILTLADGALFSDRDAVTFAYAPLSMIAPLAYWTAVIIRFVSFREANGGTIPEALQSAYYPYGFTNLDAGHTLGGLIGLLAGILVGLLLIGALFVLINRKCGRTTD